jgi:hypothetical protein
LRQEPLAGFLISPAEMRDQTLATDTPILLVGARLVGARAATTLRAEGHNSDTDGAASSSVAIVPPAKIA